MRNSLLSILVVDDDAKFSSTMIGRTLNLADYTDMRFASSAAQALTLLEERPAAILLADWLMPEIDGLELTAQVRQHDEQPDHYTYIILLTGTKSNNALAEAFDRGVDDFTSKTAMNEHQEYSPSNFKRIYDGLNIKSFKSSKGLISIKAGISLIELNSKALLVTADQLIRLAAKHLPNSYSSARIDAVRLHLPSQ